MEYRLISTHLHFSNSCNSSSLRASGSLPRTAAAAATAVLLFLWRPRLFSPLSQTASHCRSPAASCDVVPIANRRLESPKESYEKYLAAEFDEARKKARARDFVESSNKSGAVCESAGYCASSGSQDDEDEAAFGKLEDADLMWSLQHPQAGRMAIAQINGNVELEDRAVLQRIHTVSNGELLLAGVMDGHGGWQIGEGQTQGKGREMNE